MRDPELELNPDEEEIMEFVEKRYHEIMTSNRKNRKHAFDVVNNRVKKAVRTIIKI